MVDVCVIMLKTEYHHPYGRLIEGSRVDVPMQLAVTWQGLGVAKLAAGAGAVRVPSSLAQTVAMKQETAQGSTRGIWNSVAGPHPGYPRRGWR